MSLNQDVSLGQLLSLEQARRTLGISRTLLYKQMDQGKLAWVQIGRTRHIRPQDLAAFIERNCKGGRSSA